MLSSEDLERTAELKRLSLANTERDYLQELILFSLYSNMGEELVFKGGTSLYKIYKLNRFSEDLDFTLTKKTDIKKISNKIVYDLMLLNTNGKIKEITEYRNQINVRLLLNGPLYKGRKETQCFIPLNISMKEEVLVEPKKHSFISLYKELPNFEMFVMQEKEILAEKVRAIFTRTKPRDAYDLWYLLKIKSTDFDLSLINKKLSLYGLKYDEKKFREKIGEEEKLWHLDLKNLIIGNLPEFSKIKKELVSSIRK